MPFVFTVAPAVRTTLVAMPFTDISWGFGPTSTLVQCTMVFVAPEGVGGQRATGRSDGNASYALVGTGVLADASRS